MMDRPMDEFNFLYPYTNYHGHRTPANIKNNANLQELALKVSYISGLETGGKISPEQAYQEIKCLWEKFKQSRKEMGIG